MVNIILISETLNSFPLRIGIKEGCLLSPLLFKISNGIHSQCHKTRKKKPAIIHRCDYLHRKSSEFYKNTGNKAAEIKVHKQNAI